MSEYRIKMERRNVIDVDGSSALLAFLAVVDDHIFGLKIASTE